MANYEYLDKMFYRLHEAKEHRSRLRKQMKDGLPKKNPILDRECFLADNWVLAVEYSIRDYLKTHEAKP